MTEAGNSNLSYYDAMSQGEVNLLERRAGTRNHSIKFGAICEKLALDGARSKRILELGPGLGVHGRDIITKGHVYAGLDISGGLLEFARNRFPEWDDALPLQADACTIPFLDNTFDGVFCVATIHHLPDPAKGIAELVRILKPSARFCVLEPRRFYPTQLLQFLRHPATEVSAMQITAGNMRRWLGDAGIPSPEVSFRVITPNATGKIAQAFDLIDKAATKGRLAPLLAVMLCVSGTKA